jgi:hypothetical protein
MAVLLIAPTGGSVGAGQQIKNKSANPFPDDRRLEIRVTFKIRRPTFRDLLDRIEKETKVRLIADQRLEDQEATFALTVFNEPAWVVMNNITKQMLIDGRWEKIDDGYYLLGESKQPIEATAPPTLSKYLYLGIAAGVGAVIAAVLFLLARRSRAKRAAGSKPVQ